MHVFGVQKLNQKHHLSKTEILAIIGLTAGAAARAISVIISSSLNIESNQDYSLLVLLIEN